MPSVRTPEKCPSLTEKETEAESSGETGRPHPTLLGSGDEPCRWDFFWALEHPTAVLLLPEDPGESVAILPGHRCSPLSHWLCLYSLGF